MKWRPFAFAAGLVLLLSYGVSAEFYQYKDKDGTIRYTDDATIIPEEHLSDMIIHESVRTEPPEEVVAQQPVDFYQEESDAAPGMHEASADEPAEDVTEAGVGAPPPPTGAQDKMEKRKEYEELNAMRDELQRAYLELEAEKKAVGPPPPSGAKTGEMADYVQKRKELEQKIEAYNKKSETFDENVKAFNRGVMQ